MPAARGTKRTASKTSAVTASSAPKNKKKRGGAVLLEIPSAPKKRGSVLTCGQGDVGQLGLGEDVMETTEFRHVAGLGNKIVDAHAGGMHTIALDCDGKVWTFGCNDEGALGRPTSNEKDEGTPKAVALPQPAVAIAAGDSHSAALLDNGDVYAWGAFRDSHGSMGLIVRAREGKACKEPVKVDIGEQAVALASGGDHLVMLSVSGSVYTMGCGEQGQLGRLSQRSASRDARQGFSALLTPSKVTLKAGASRIWAGYHATFVLDANKDKVFAWGLNNYGQLGITGEKRKTALFSPAECDAFAGSSWSGVAAGQHHSLAVDDAGRAHAIGRCEYGRLGLGDKSGDAEILEPIPKLQNKNCVSIAAGTSNSFAVTSSGEVMSWGMGSEGQLGTGSSQDAAEPTSAVCATHQDRTPIHVSAGGQHTVLLVEDPNPQKERSPTPEKETQEEKTEPVEEEKKKRPTKRQKKQEQDEEITSTSSSAQPATTEDVPEKVNGNEKKAPETPMDIDDTDNPKETTDTDTDIQTADTKETESEKESQENMDTSSQDTEDSKDSKEEREKEMETTPAVAEKESEVTEVNGTQESEVKESKTVETLPPAAISTA
ncbi:regulator of chromosome condensation [Bicyclus anynana]|uniref:Regulator of chromosome condensation n=1 Tax=Bicyclus anynana TaxID=110368 RepID=A0ABM3LUK9_BICAN|nr:regulator of chromosome condensation [Bicyclus anynana]XP_052742752.1 regulator of chromosome condensation [Bicyclus anynana]